jgi:thioredoxin reductase (NADPH)
MTGMMEQAKRFGGEIASENVISVNFSSRPFTVKTDAAEYKTKSVIIATGAEANWLNLDSEQKLRGKGVSACATCDGFFFKDKEVAVIGGGDSAMEEANFLTKFATQVTIVHRRSEFKASKVMLKRAQDNPKISFVTNVQVLEVLGENAVEGLKVKDNQTGEEKSLAVQGVFLAIGHTPATKAFKVAGIETDEKGYIKITNQTKTNIEGVFVAGDVADHRYRQAVSAAGAGCMAALDAEKYLAEQE